MEVTQQAQALFRKWLRKNNADELHTKCIDDLQFEMYRTEHRRDLALDDALADLIEHKRLEFAPIDTQTVALANLRYEDVKL